MRSHKGTCAEQDTPCQLARSMSVVRSTIRLRRGCGCPAGGGGAQQTRGLRQSYKSKRFTVPGPLSGGAMASPRAHGPGAACGDCTELFQIMHLPTQAFVCYQAGRMQLCDGPLFYWSPGISSEDNRLEPFEGPGGALTCAPQPTKQTCGWCSAWCGNFWRLPYNMSFVR